MIFSNIDINKETRKYMKELNTCEMYAVRRVGIIIIIIMTNG